MDERVEGIKSLIKKDIDLYSGVIGRDISEDLGTVLLGWVSTAHIDAGALTVSALMGLGELEEQLSKPGKEVKFRNTCECIAKIKGLYDSQNYDELAHLRSYANQLMGYDNH